MPITSDVVEFIARKVVSSNIREPRGGAQPDRGLRLDGRHADLDRAPARPSSRTSCTPKKRQVTPERIAKAVSDYYSVPMDALQGQKRDKAIVVPARSRCS